MSWLFHVLANTPPGRVFMYLMSLFWGALFLAITAKLILQHGWGYALLTAILAAMFLRRFIIETKKLIARYRRRPEKLSGPAPTSPRR